MMNRVCTLCGQEKLLSEFGKHVRMKGGIRPACKSCTNEENRKWRADHPDKVADMRRSWRARNKDKSNAYALKYYAQAPEKFRKRSAEYKKENPQRTAACAAVYAKTEKRRAYIGARKPQTAAGMRKRRLNPAQREKDRAISKAWAKKNPAKNAAAAMRYYTAKRGAVPRWADPVEILRRYDWARLITEETGIPHEVDHIVPLKSALVCGLHWHGNLRVVSKSENCAKRNFWWPDMPERAA